MKNKVKDQYNKFYLDLKRYLRMASNSMNDIELLKKICQMLKQKNDSILDTVKKAKNIFKKHSGSNDYQLVKNLEPEL